MHINKSCSLPYYLGYHYATYSWNNKMLLLLQTSVVAHIGFMTNLVLIMHLRYSIWHST
jgi:hypothetical protein